MTKLKFSILPGRFNIHRLNTDAEIPAEIYNSFFYSVTKSEHELSIVIPDDLKIESEKCEENWKCLKILGPLDFDMTGLLAGISKILSDKEISIFAVSTFDTDYILVKNEKLNHAVITLELNGYKLKADS
ncbi:ACT domain-containing protein [Bacteroidota bacterium]